MIIIIEDKYAKERLDKLSLIGLKIQIKISTFA